VTVNDKTELSTTDDIVRTWGAPVLRPYTNCGRAMHEGQ
jgi:hypothetical protein